MTSSSSSGTRCVLCQSISAQARSINDAASLQYVRFKVTPFRFLIGRGGFVLTTALRRPSSKRTCAAIGVALHCTPCQRSKITSACAQLHFLANLGLTAAAKPCLTYRLCIVGSLLHQPYISGSSQVIHLVGGQGGDETCSCTPSSGLRHATSACARNWPRKHLASSDRLSPRCRPQRLPTQLCKHVTMHQTGGRASAILLWSTPATGIAVG